MGHKAFKCRKKKGEERNDAKPIQHTGKPFTGRERSGVGCLLQVWESWSHCICMYEGNDFDAQLQKREGSRHVCSVGANWYYEVNG